MIAGRWIPPQGLIFGQLAHGASWIVLLALATGAQTVIGLQQLGWVHLVALGWLTTIALSVLVHVIPAFTDVTWRAERTARRSLAVYGAGVLVLVAGFLAGMPRVLPWGGALIAIGLAGYTIPALLTLRGALREGRVERAIARALGTTLLFLLVAAGLGVAFTCALSGVAPLAIVAAAAPVHAEFGAVGWLTVLAMGVSTRTIRPIAGLKSPRGWMHVTAGFTVVFGIIVLAAGQALESGLALWTGTAVLGVGIAVYVLDLVAVLRCATVRHRPPQAFLGAAVSWLAAAYVLGSLALTGVPCGAAAVYALLAGWLGQIVNAHLHHIGVRLLATVYRGDDDETRPEELLSSRLSWSAFGLSQVAVGVGIAAIVAHVPDMLALAAFAGFAGWCAMAANAVVAARRAQHAPGGISLLHDHPHPRS